jgi:hypothetical protein
MNDSIFRIRLVCNSDEPQLSKLYEYLNTCNGKPENCNQIIAESLASLKSRQVFKSITFVVEDLQASTEDNSLCIVASSRLIKLGEDAFPTMMYVEQPQGLLLTPYKEEAVEFAGAVVHPQYQKQGLGKALTMIRAFLARTFSGVMGTERVLVEFLPQYHPNTVINDFWLFLIQNYLDTEALQNALFRSTGVMPQNEQELAKILVRDTDSLTRNRLINTYFPTWITSVPPEIRSVIQNVNQNSYGAFVNLQRCYSALDKVGVFAVDGGSNYSAWSEHGSHGDRTVECHYSDDYYTERAIVFNPFTSRLSSLKNLEIYLCYGLFQRTFAKLPKRMQTYLNHSGDDQEATYLLLKRDAKI